MSESEKEPQLVSVDALAASGWRDALASAGRDGYSGAHGAFATAAKAAHEAADHERASCLRLLGAICSMYLRPDSPNAPFGPMWSGPDGRTMLPEDISGAQMLELSAFAASIDSDLLRARIFDLAWLTLRPRRAADARSAIESYRALLSSLPHDEPDVTHFFERALALARMVGDEASHTAIIDVLAESVLSHSSSALVHSRLLYERNELRDKASLFAIALTECGSQDGSAGKTFRARDCLSEARKWHERAGDSPASAQVALQIADSFVAEAEARAAATPPSNIAAAHFLESAIQTLRSIPRQHRESLGIEGKLETLHKRLAEAGAKSLEEMGTISSGEIDISEMVAAARAAVQGRDQTEALLRMAHITRIQSVADIRSTVEEQARKAPLRLLFGATSLSGDGRVVSRRPGLSLSDEDSDSRELVLWGEMVQHFQLTLGLAVQGQIMPALNALLLEHTVREDDLILLCERSPIVPPGRERTFARGLFAGFERDFLTAIHILAPQMEALVRWHLKQAGVRTTSLDANGIMNESSLGTLLEKTEAAQVFGDNVAFELRALLADPVGPNLRNEVAHGLVDDERAFSIYSAYAWWLTLHLVFSTFWNALRAQRDAGTSADDSADPDVEPDSTERPG